MRRLLHISDLHFGRIESRACAALLAEIERLRPEVTVVSGDLTQRARPRQFRQARRFLDRLPQPCLIVPGNHDVPLWNPFLRFVAPLRRYRRYIADELMPCYQDSEILIQGLSTAKAWTISGGGIRREDLERVARIVTEAPADVTKIIVSHHPLDPFAMFRAAGWGRNPFVKADGLRGLQIDLYLCGHLHQGRSETTGAWVNEAHRAALVVQAGTSTSTRTRREANSFNLIEIDRPRVRVLPFVFSEKSGNFLAQGESTFYLSADGWVPERGP